MYFLLHGTLQNPSLLAWWCVGRAFLPAAVKSSAPHAGDRCWAAIAGLRRAQG